MVERVLRSGFEVCSVLISDRKFASFEDRLPADISVYRLSADLADALVGFQLSLWRYGLRNSKTVAVHRDMAADDRARVDSGRRSNSGSGKRGGTRSHCCCICRSRSGFGEGIG